jgi:hypothetical protein
VIDAFEPDLHRCASCHDQCLFGTVEVFARSSQSLATSRKALLLLQIAERTMNWTPAAVDVVFSALNSGIQHTMCVHRGDPSGWPDETAYIRAARADVVAQGLAPAWAQALRQMTHTTGDPYGIGAEQPRPAEVLLVADAATRRWDPTWRRDWMTITRKLGIDAGWLAEGSSGFELVDLGYASDARSAAALLREAIDRAKPKTIVSDSPEAAWMMERVWPSWGLGLDVPVQHVSVWLDAALAGTNNPAPNGPRLAFHDPSALARGLSIVDPPRAVLRALGIRLVEFVRYGDEALPVGSYQGAEVGPWVRRLAEDRIGSAIVLNAEGIIVGSPFDLRDLTSERLPVHPFLHVAAQSLMTSERTSKPV